MISKWKIDWQEAKFHSCLSWVIWQEATFLGKLAVRIHVKLFLLENWLIFKQDQINLLLQLELVFSQEEMKIMFNRVGFPNMCYNSVGMI